MNELAKGQTMFHCPTCTDPSLARPRSAVTFHNVLHASLDRLGHQTKNTTSFPKALQEQAVTSNCRRGLKDDIGWPVSSAVHPLMHERGAARRKFSEADD